MQNARVDCVDQLIVDHYYRWVFFRPSADWPRWWDSHLPNTRNYSIKSGEPLRSYWLTVRWSTQSTLTLKSDLRSYWSTVSWSTQSTLKSPLSIRSSHQHNQLLLSRALFYRIDQFDRQSADRHNQLLLWRLHMITVFIFISLNCVI